MRRGRSAARGEICLVAVLLTLFVGGYLTLALFAEGFGCGHDGDLPDARCESDETATGLLFTGAPVVWSVGVYLAWSRVRWWPIGIAVAVVLVMAATAGYLPGMRHSF